MRIAILSTILATAATLAACSGGGPGSIELSALDLGREPVTDGTFGAPYEPPPNRAGSLPTEQGKDPQKPPRTSNNTGDPPPTTPIPTSGSDSGVVGRDSGATRIEDGSPGGATCADLAACCPSLPTSAKPGCEALVTNDDNPSCSSALKSYKQAGYCN